MGRMGLVKAMCRLAVPAGAALAVLLPPATASAVTLTQTGSYSVPTSSSGQGLATLSTKRGSTTIVYRGDSSIPLRLALQGWQHIGDPGAGGLTGQPRNYIFDAYQGSSNMGSKMFEVTTPNGKRYDFVHKLVSGEAYNNSFAAITPDGKWLVSGEWGTMNRFLIFPAPVLNSSVPANSTARDLPLVGYITLGSTTVQNVQGCDFQSDTVLLCSSDGPSKEIIQVNLQNAVSNTDDAATGVSTVGYIPLDSVCSGTYEAEGIDYYKSQIHVEIIPPSPCSINTKVYVYSYSS